LTTITSPRRGRIDPTLFGGDDLTNLTKLQLSKSSVNVDINSNTDLATMEEKEKKPAVSMEPSHPIKKELKVSAIPLSKLKAANQEYRDLELKSLPKRSGGSIFGCMTTTEINSETNVDKKKRRRRVKSLTLKRKGNDELNTTRDSITRAQISLSDVSFPDIAFENNEHKKKKGKSGLKKKKKKRSAIDKFLKDSPRGEYISESPPKWSPKSSPRISPKSSPKSPKESPKKSPWSPKGSPKGSPKKINIVLSMSPVRKRKTSLSVINDEQSLESLSPKDRAGK